MKYEYGIIVCYKNAKDEHDIYTMLIMGFDEKSQKYICLSADKCCIDDDSVVLTLYSESDLTLFENYKKKYSLIKNLI